MTLTTKGQGALARPVGVSVVMPCLNEVESVALCVREALDCLRAAGIDGEVVVVDNGSTDGSVEAAAKAGARVVSESRRGYGSALRRGFREARHQVLVMADADWTYDFSKIPMLVGPILEGRADMVIGSRLEAAVPQTMPILHRYLGTPLLSFLVRRATNGLSVQDSQSGYRAFTSDVARQMKLKSGGMELASEMIIRAGQQSLRVIELPAGYRKRIGDSKLNAFADGWRHLRLITLLAPQIVLFGPGLALLLVGLLLTLWAFIVPAGLQVGELRWQPVFLSTIAVTIGGQLAILGMVLTNRSSLAPEGVRARFRFIDDVRLPVACMGIGAVILGLGTLTDGILFVRWVLKAPATAFGLPLAAAAQTLMINGALLSSLGLVLRYLHWADRRSDEPIP